MDRNKIRQMLIEQLTLDEVIVNGNGNYFQIIAVGEVFNGMNRIEQQQLIYAPLMRYITDNKIHALSIKTYTPIEWRRDCKLKSF